MLLWYPTTCKGESIRYIWCEGYIIKLFYFFNIDPSICSLCWSFIPWNRLPFTDLRYNGLRIPLISDNISNIIYMHKVSVAWFYLLFFIELILMIPTALDELTHNPAGCDLAPNLSFNCCNFKIFNGSSTFLWKWGISTSPDLKIRLTQGIEINKVVR